MRKTNQPCPFDGCESSDAYTEFDDGGGKCFSCGQYSRATRTDNDAPPVDTTSKSWQSTQSRLCTSAYAAAPDRCLSVATCEKYSALVRGNTVVFGYYTPDNKYEPVAAKLRLDGKKFLTQGDFKGVGLYGEWLFSGGGKYLTITEGEYDALSSFQMNGSKYPSVSIKHGAQGAVKDCKASYDFINSFDAVVFDFDDDAAGRKAASDCAALFGGKAKIVKHAKGFKDASDYLVAGKIAEYKQAWWSAEQYVPDGIVNGSSLWDLVSEPIEESMSLYPWEGLNDITYGIRQSELVTVTAGSGLGKSQFIREIIYYLKQNTDKKMGLLMLEESLKRTALSLMSLRVNKLLHLPTTETTIEEKQEAFNALFGDERVYMMEHFGSTEVDNIVSRIRYMAVALDCGIVFLDHVSIVVSAQSNGDERKALDEIMTRLRMLVQETGIALFLVSHLKRPSGAGHEEGAATSLSQLRGSASIGQLSDMVLGLERDGQADDPVIRNTTKVRVLKNRFSGETGPACDLLYDRETGRLDEYNLEEAL